MFLFSVEMGAPPVLYRDIYFKDCWYEVHSSLKCTPPPPPSAEKAAYALGLHNSNTPVLLEEEMIAEVESFKYLGSIIDKQGGADKDVLTRIGKAGEPHSTCSKAFGSLESLQ